ncbi:MAG: hypothetical protein LBO06_03380 [Bacteroidales bacterium]|nr:hypothetical protein [Bacteroidales bacterium]
MPKKEWQNEGKSILETLFDVKNIEEEAEKTEKIKPQKAKVETKKELKPNPTYEDRNQALEEQNKERKFSLAEAVIYSSILERPYK